MTERVLGPFILDEQIGSGGMGHVYRARYAKTGQVLALKLLSAAAHEDEKLVARFQRELDILQRVRHPHIVQCYGGGRLGTRRFFAMEFIPGGTLLNLLKQRQQLPWKQVAEYARQVALALQAAHEQGVIHRDLKPANLMLDEHGSVKLTDFGLARLKNALALTVAGRTLGTCQYMAPEQINGKYPISPRTDLYALGIVMFELLVGRPPFYQGNMVEVMEQHLRQPVPEVGRLVPNCHQGLVDLIDLLLQKHPQHRPEDAGTVALQLGNLLELPENILVPALPAAPEDVLDLPELSLSRPTALPQSARHSPSKPATRRQVAPKRTTVTANPRKTAVSPWWSRVVARCFSLFRFRRGRKR